MRVIKEMEDQEFTGYLSLIGRDARNELALAVVKEHLRIAKLDLASRGLECNLLFGEMKEVE